MSSILLTLTHVVPWPQFLSLRGLATFTQRLRAWCGMTRQPVVGAVSRRWLLENEQMAGKTRAE